MNPIGVRSCYDEGKRCAEILFFDYHRQHDLKIKVARIFNTYGRRMHHSDCRVVSNFIVQALQDKPITIFGEGQQTRALCYVDDLITAFIKLTDTQDEVTGRVNIGNPGEFTIWQLAEQVIELTGSKSELVYSDLPMDDPQQRRPDISLAQKTMGWTPQIKLRDGLERTVTYFQEQLPEIKKR